MARPSYAQLEKLIEFMEENPKFAKGLMRCTPGRYETQLKWEELANILNNMDGITKTARQWSRFWADKKYSIKKRQVAQRNASAYRLRYGLDDDAPPLSNLDDRILLLVTSKNLDLSKKKKETIVKPKEKPTEQPKPSTSRVRSSRSPNTALRRSPRLRLRDPRSQVNMERHRLITIEEKRVQAETVQAVGWCKAAKALRHLAKAVVQCGRIIADALVNRDG
ncbi:hypothetical protein PYW08_000538 [Mythimna loreyi]|uniref:Uncharacterized protein n=1 Tax=Mythimna loreyi TaxID=667449 RepID=A0ACC2RCR1_9NEOP|nr:hypothetical protein PYW08_000538 [Mythimna loreyi]